MHSWQPQMALNGFNVPESSTLNLRQIGAQSILNMIRPPTQPPIDHPQQFFAPQQNQKQVEIGKNNAFLLSLQKHAYSSSDLSIESHETQDHVIHPYTHDSTEGMNYMVLRRHDPLLNEIKYTSPHAVLYKFVPDTGAWEKLSCQGVLFIYTRPSDTRNEEDYALMILNRHSVKNFMIKLRDVTDVERPGDFMMMRSVPGATERWEIGYEDESDTQPDVYGLWIYAEDDREDVEELVRDHKSESVSIDTVDIDADDVNAANGNGVLDKLFSQAVKKFVLSA
ncbi:hypothetical protein V1512DRAFT_258704 [Lipomyces arxii]|uniref:uncharacterized protein n=1 Tax=Lipomyces arxii TaxID=56418 RepID=UPI0034CFCF36